MGAPRDRTNQPADWLIEGHRLRLILDNEMQIRYESVSL